MSLYSILVQFLPLLGVFLALAFLYLFFLVPEKIDMGEGFPVNDIMLPIMVLSAVVVLLLVTNMYGV